MRMSVTDEGDSPHQPVNTFIVGQARDGSVETRDFISKAFPGDGVKSVDVPARKFGGKITKVCAPSVRSDVRGRVLRRARGQKNGER